MEHFLVHLMTSGGYLAFIVLAFLQACCIPISSEVTFAFAGVIAATNPDKFSLVGVIVIGVIAEMAGSFTSYGIGRRGGRRFLETRYGGWVVTHSDLERAERLFTGRGAWAVAVGRALPVVRCFASFGAGVLEIPFLPFAVFSFIGTAIWATCLTFLGYNLGDTVHKFFNTFTWVGGGLVILFLVALVAHRVHEIRKDNSRRFQEAPVTRPASHRARR